MAFHFSQKMEMMHTLITLQLLLVHGQSIPFKLPLMDHYNLRNYNKLYSMYLSVHPPSKMQVPKIKQSLKTSGMNSLEIINGTKGEGSNRASNASLQNQNGSDSAVPRSKSQYWTVSYGNACRNGFSCRECRALIPLNAPVAIRDGRKMRLFYHLDCFTHDSDPRTQNNSSFQRPEFGKSFQAEAPAVKGKGKWSVSFYGYSPNRF